MASALSSVASSQQARTAERRHLVPRSASAGRTNPSLTGIEARTSSQQVESEEFLFG